MSKEFSLPVSMMLRPILRQYFKQVWVEDNGVRHYTTNLTANRAGPENSPGQSPSILGSSGFVGGTLFWRDSVIDGRRSQHRAMGKSYEPYTAGVSTPLETWNSLTSLDTQVRPSFYQSSDNFGVIPNCRQHQCREVVLGRHVKSAPCYYGMISRFHACSEAE